MARLHSDTGQRTVYLPDGTARAQGRICLVFKSPPAAAVPVLADLAYYDPATPDTPGAAIAGAQLTVDEDSLRPAFWDLNDLPELWISVSGGTLVPILPDAQPQLDEHTERLDTAESVAAVQGGRLSAAEALATSQGTRLTSAEGTLTSHGSRLTSAESTVTSQGSRLTTAEGTITSQGTRLTTAESTVTGHGTRLTSAESTITSHGTRLGTAEGNVTSQGSRITTLESTATTTGTRLTAIEGEYGIAVHKSSNNLTVRSKFDTTHDVLMPIVLSYSLNACVGFWHGGLQQVNTVLSSASDASVFPVLQGGVGTPIHDMSDDNCPINVGATSAALGYSYIGGNHGFNYAARITQSGHGKTTADLGSLWTDTSGTRMYTLIRIVSVNELWMAYPYDVVTGIPINTAPTGTSLTHVSGATNTSSINMASVMAPGWQITPGIQVESIDVKLDGKTLGEGKTLGDELVITETYMIPTYQGLVDTARANIGVPFQSLWSTMPKMCRVTNSYKWQKSGTLVISQRVAALTTFRLSMGVTQMFPLTAPAGGVRKQFMPNVSVAGTLNWSDWANINTLPGGNTDFSPSVLVDNTFPAQSATQWAYDASDVPQWGVAVGFLPIGDAHPDVRRTNTTFKGWFMSGSFKKNYPQLVWAKQLNDGDEVAGTAYRQYLPAPQTATEIVVSDGTHDFVVIEKVGTAGYSRVIAPDLVNRKLVAAGPVNLTAPARVVADGVPYTVPTSPGYGVWRAAPDVTVAKSDLGLANVDDTADLAKPVSTATLALVTAKTPDVQTFTTPGNSPWVKPSGAVAVQIIAVGGGGGGASGRRGATGTACGGGGGGAGGGIVNIILPASAFGSSHTITVGAGGTGGAAVAADDTNGVNGGNGLGSIISGILTVYGGLGGTAGAVGAGAGGTSMTGTSAAGGAGSAGATPGIAPPNPINGSFGGAGGGGITAANAASNGGAFSFLPISSTIANGAAGLAAGAVDGGSGGNQPAGTPLMGGSAGGGASNLTGAAGAGGTGGRYGCGGGGGGASRNGSASGKGGDGAPGIVQIVTYR